MERKSCVRTPADAVSVVRLSASSVECLEGDAPDHAQLIGQFELNGKRSYLARGPALEVINPSNGSRQAAWRFRCEGHPVITAVCEVSLEDSKNLLVIGVRIDSGEGLVALFDPILSRVFKVIKFPKYVTALEGIDAATVADNEAPALGGVVGAFAGCVAVGTQGGLVYLLDLRVDDENEEFSEFQPSSIKIVKAAVQAAQQERHAAKGDHRHLCVQLGASDHARGSFKYFATSNDKAIAHVYENDVHVSALKYLKVCNCLAVGYSIGGFQLFDLGHHAMIIGSNIEIHSPVTHFALLEPENDPLPCFFLWASLAESPKQSTAASLSMYQLFFTSKTSPDDEGPSQYRNLTGMNCRFFHQLVSPGADSQTADSGLSSRVISLASLGENRPGGPRLPSEDDSVRIRDMTMLKCVWECSPRDHSSPPDTFMGIFDINHWYNAQMPPEIRKCRNDGVNGICPYFTFLSLNPVLGGSPDAVLHAVIDLASLSRCSLGPHPLPNNFFWPSAMSFSAQCLTATSVVRCRFLSLQQEVLDELCSQGAAALVDPSKYVGLCWQAGLLQGMLVDNPLMQDLQVQRNSLLSIALQFNAPSFLVSCAIMLASGALSRSGVTLRMLADWALVEIRSHKQHIDDLSLPLLDGSGQLSQQQLSGIDYHAMSLQNLTLLFRVLIDKAPASTTQEGLQSLNGTYEACSLLSQHALTVVWMAAHKMLPEVNEPDDDGVGFVYPYETLAQIQRKSLDALASNGQQMLMIDLLLERWKGSIDSIWGASARGTGSYPPPNLHALLNIFFVVRQVPATIHSFVIFYTLLDISLVFSSVKADRDAWLELAQQYAQAFGMDSQAVTMLRGFWALDRRDFELALRLLTQPGNTVSLVPHQEHHILQAFLYAGEAKLAAMYLQRVAVSTANVEHINITLDTLIANGLVAEAFEYQRRTSAPGETELFTHLLQACHSHRLLHKLSHLPLTDEEERVWVDFLEESSSAPHMELLVMYYLQRARYVEAIRLNEKLQAVSDYADAESRDRAIVREAIVQGYCQALPLVQRQLANELSCPAPHPKPKDVRPVPLSMTISQASARGRPLTEAHLITMAMEKVTEARAEPVVEATPFKKKKLVGVQSSPFIGTPRISTHKSRIVDPVPLLNASPALIMDDEPPQLADISMDNLAQQSSVSTVNASWQTLPASIAGGSFMSMSSSRPGTHTPAKAPSTLSMTSQGMNSVLSPNSILKPMDLATSSYMDASLNAIPTTPHSILKVRHVSPQERASSVTLSPPRSPPRSDQEQAALLAHRELPLSRLIGQDYHLATPPSVVGRPVKSRVLGQNKSDTPRRIRFANMDDDEDDDEEESDNVAEEETSKPAKDDDRSQSTAEDEDDGGVVSALKVQVDVVVANARQVSPGKVTALEQSPNNSVLDSSVDDDGAEDFLSAEEDLSASSTHMEVAAAEAMTPPTELATVALSTKSVASFSPTKPATAAPATRSALTFSPAKASPAPATRSVPTTRSAVAFSPARAGSAVSPSAKAPVAVTPSAKTAGNNDNPMFQFTPPNTRATKAADKSTSPVRKPRVAAKVSDDILFSPPWTRSRVTSTPVTPLSTRFSKSSTPVSTRVAKPADRAASPTRKSRAAPKAAPSPPPVETMDDGAELASEQSLFLDPVPAEQVPTTAIAQPPATVATGTAAVATSPTRRSRRLTTSTTSIEPAAPHITPMPVTPVSGVKSKRSSRPGRSSTKPSIPTVADVSAGSGGNSTSAPLSRMTLRRRNPEAQKTASQKK